MATLWTEVHTSAFERLKAQIAKSTELAHPKHDHQTCLFTDASGTQWAGVFTQIPLSDVDKQVEDQQHEPLAFLSGKFSAASLNRSIPDKEVFDIIESITRMDYLLKTRIVSIFTDNATLVYIYDPMGQTPGIPRHIMSKLLRWSIKLSEFQFFIEHIEAHRNVWADMLTRWAFQPSNEIKTQPHMLATLLMAPMTPSISES